MARSSFLFPSRRRQLERRDVRLNRRPLRPQLESLEQRDLLASYTAIEDTPLVVSDPNLLHAGLIAGPTHGKVTFSDAGGFTYTPAEDYNGQDAFVYGFANSAAGTTLTGNETAAITIKSVNDAPSGTDVVRQVSANAAYALQPGDFGFTDSKDHPSNNLKAVQIVTLPTAGKLVDGDTPVVAGQTIPLSDFISMSAAGSVSPSNRVRYIPDPTNTTATSSVSFTFAVQDDGGTENHGIDTDPSPNKFTIYVASIVQPPKLTANPDTYGLVQGATLTIGAPGLLGNDSKVGDGIVAGSWMAKLKDGPAHGDLMLNGDGSFTYKPTADYAGTDSFTYFDTATYVPPSTNGAISDPLIIVSNTTTVTIGVRSTAPIVVANNDTYYAIQNTPLGITAPGVLKNDVVYSADATNTTPGTTSILNLPLNATIVTNVSHGTLTLALDGSFNYTPAKNYYGADTFTYRAKLAPSADGTTQAPNPISHDVATVTIYVAAPVANNDVYGTPQNTPLNISAPGVLANDKAADGHTMSALLVHGTSHGDVSLNTDGSFTYKPASGYAGADTFTYRAIDTTTVSLGDSSGDSNTATASAVGTDAQVTNLGGLATVTIYVKPLPPAIIANNDTFLAAINGTLDVTAPGVLKNDYVILGDPTTGTSGATNASPLPNYPLMAVLVSTTTNGTLELHSDGSFHYVPNKDFDGSDTFTYQAILNPSATADPTATTAVTSAIATVTINVKPIPPSPVAVDDSYSMAAGTQLKIGPPGVTANDTKADGAKLLTVIGSKPSNGNLEFHSDGSFSYTPFSGFTGADTFTYQDLELLSDPAPPPDDPNHWISNFATVTINVKPIVTKPVVVANNDSFDDAAGKALDIALPGVLKNDYVLYVDPTTGAATNVTAAGTTTPPTFPLSAVLVSPPSSGGTVELHSDGSFHYVPKDGFTGQETFTYRAMLPVVDPPTGGDPPAGGDATTASGTTIAARDVATVTINVRPVNVTPVPVAVNDYYLTAENTTLGIGMPGVLSNDYIKPSPVPPVQPDSTATVNNVTNPIKIPLTAVLVAGPANGTLTLNGDGSFKYAPKGDFVGTDTFTYQDSFVTPTADGTPSATDSAPILSNIATVSIRVVAAVAHNDSYATDINTALDVTAPGVLGNDAGGSTTHPLMSTLLSGPMHGTLKLGADGSFHYEPAANYSGPDTFSYRASDGTTTTDPTTTAVFASSVSGDANRPINAYDIGVVKIYVRPPAPTIQAHDDKYLTPENTTLTIDAPGVLANDYGPVNVPVIAALVDKPTHGTVTVGDKGDFTYVPETDFVGEDKFTYSASVAAAAGSTTSAIKSGLATVVIYVAAPNATPRVILGDNQTTTDESGPQKVTDWAAVVAVDGDGAPPAITVSTDKPNLFSAPPSIDATGQLIYTPAPNASGSATITVTTGGDPTTGDPGDTETFTIYIDKPHAFTNTVAPCDVTDDNTVAADDALSIINYISAHGSSQISQVPTNLVKHLYYDVDKDGWIAAIDVLNIINYINAHPDQSAPATDANVDSSLLTLIAQDTADSTTGKKKT